jgi:phytoene synthase
MSDDALLAQLPIEQRLALAYGPRPASSALLTVLALDARLADVVRTAREPVLGQIKLAWWREKVGAGGSAAIVAEPLLDRIATDMPDPATAIGLVDGWEGMLGEGPIGGDAISALAEARAEAFAMVGARFAKGSGCTEPARAARGWALADLAARLTQPGERSAAIALADQQDWRRAALPRALRALAVLHALARRRHDGCGLLTEKRAFLVALRVGLFNV